jgi:Domain of unknown function (DUF4209)
MGEREEQPDVPLEERARRVAEAFWPDYSGDDHTWGTYYGPQMAATDASGQRIEVPSIADVTPEILSCWAEQARVESNAARRARYADLVWDFTKPITGKNADPDFARIAIDATLEVVAGNLLRSPTDGKTRLRRSLSLALSLNDTGRVEAVRDAVIAFEDAVAEDDKPGLWGFAFDMLLENKKVPVTREQQDKIIVDLEDRLARLTTPRADGTPPNGHAAEAAVMPLVQHYRRVGRPDDVQRVLRIYAQAFHAMADAAPGVLGAAWLQKVHEVLGQHGMKAEAEGTAVRLRELEAETIKQMKPISVSVEIPADEFERYIEAMTAGSLSDALTRIAWQFLPEKDKVASRVKEQAKRSPLFSLFRPVILDHEGRPVAEIGSVEDDLEGRVVQEMAREFQIIAPYLRGVFRRLQQAHNLSVADLLDYFSACPLFTAKKRPILEAGLAAYLRDDALVAMHILPPMAEDAVRTLVARSGGSIRKLAHRGGGIPLKLLDELLREPTVIAALSERVAHYLRVLLTDQRGWNLRNGVGHGLFPASFLQLPIADRMVHALLLLGLVRPGDPDQRPAATSSGARSLVE